MIYKWKLNKKEKDIFNKIQVMRSEYIDGEYIFKQFMNEIQGELLLDMIYNPEKINGA